jgi:stage V sporulation protein G
MKITAVKIYEFNKDKLRAFATITLDECMVITGLKVFDSSNGYFVGMPSKKNTRPNNGEQDYKQYLDIAYPCTKDFRNELQTAVLTAYHDFMQQDVKVDAVVDVVSKRPDTPSIDVSMEDLPF